LNTEITKQKQATFIDRNELLLLSEKVVSKYAYTIPEREREDVKMSIIEKYLTQEEKIIKQFKGQSKFTTYCYAILNRICCGIIRSELKNWQQNNEIMKDSPSMSVSPAENYIIKDEISFLSKILMTLDQPFKIIIFLAFLYRLEPKSNYINQYDFNYKKNKLLKLLSKNHGSSKAELYAIMAKLVYLVENKLMQSDAVRMWLNKQRTQAINRLNGPFKRANYDKESFQILFENFYAQ
jgi:hypothetical protein